MHYTLSKLQEGREEELGSLIKKHLTNNDEGNVVATVAQKLISQGEARGKSQGLSIGEARGKKSVIMNMLRKNLDINSIADFTGLSVDEVTKIKKSPLNKSSST